MASTSSSSRSMPNAPRTYDVFISFRGEDTRNNFTSHLHNALKQASLEVFLDDEKLEKGDEIAPSLIQAIKDSNVSLIVFSPDYASSKWCLDELVQIMQYRKEEGQFVIPIFYKVEPTHVRKQTGAYGKAFEKHEINIKHDPDRLSKWRSALSQSADLSGGHCESFTNESKFIQQIVADVKTKLEHISDCQGTLRDVIGIDEMIEPIEQLLEKSNRVGIWGMGGVGKSTMAKVVLAKLSYRYDTCCFLKNIREETERNGLGCVSKFLVSKLLGQDMQSNAFLSRRLGSKIALVVLDDVGSFEQLEELQDNICNYLKEGSKVIITTRDQQLLRAYGYEIHEAKGLSYDNDRKLFISKAFCSSYPEDEYKVLIEGFVDYTKHNPLALKVLGSSVCSVPKKAWDGLLRKLRGGSPNHKIQNMLRLSYDGLDDKDKQAFLDIACFLKGESEECVEELLENYDFYPTYGIQILKDKALISVTTNGNVEMHDLIQEMGHQIVREEDEEPGKRSRLWNPSEICDVLENCEGRKMVEGIKFSAYWTKPLELNAKTFNKMTRIRFLEIYSHGHVSIPKDLESISEKVRYFHWEGYPRKSLPSKFCAKFLVELNLRNSLVETLWKGVQDLANLRRLKLQRCHNLRELPDFSKACRLESVDLFGCASLRYVLCPHSLISLDVRHCFSLERLQSNIHLKSLKQVNASGCMNLKEFSMSSEELTYLDLYETKIEELSSAIGRCSKLETLNLSCANLFNFPTDVLSFSTSLAKLKLCLLLMNDYEGLRVLFGHLHNLQSLTLDWCWNLKELPDNITQISSLEELYLDHCNNLTKLPENIRHLSKLQILFMEHCTALQSLPELPPTVRIFVANFCTSLERVSTSTISSTPHNYGKKLFSFINCVNLDLGTIEEQAMRLLQKAVHEKEDVAIYYPGNKVPKWFGDNRNQHDSDNVQLSPSSHNLLGFVFCAIVPNFSISVPEMVYGVEEDKRVLEEIFPSILEFHTQEDHFVKTIYVRPGNVLLRHNPNLSDWILEKIEGNKRNHESTTYKPNLFFKFTFSSQTARESGVCPIYASEYSGLKFYSRKRKANMT